MGLFSWPYPSEQVTGYWGEVTSTIDWCEENYVVSKYIAEWSNTITNGTFVITALYSTYCAWRNRLELRFLWIGVGFALVGVGSWLFHMTLQYHYQLLDEMPMIYATCIPTWSILCETKDTLTGKGQSSPLNRQISIAIAITTIVSLLSWIYLVFKIPEIHQTVYGFITVLVVIMSGFLTYKYVDDKVAKKSLYQCMTIGIVTFLAGFISWNLDNLFCSFWIHVRRSYLELPLGVFLELHAWWHILTGTGIYYYIVYLQYLRVLTQGFGNDFKLIWRWKFLPELVRKDSKITTKYSLSLMGPYVEKQDGETRKNK
ncbi:hypothetical protein HG535_0H02650 [Zygotorulaspora mrakii]|uniref:Alkaline ceramidase n=1 Tax=Zygotorulaspora mrakii TaxID=42260 RepID=A0A7H9B859_ZYGMR|nr:uncharacterized protein HG535_0H02650 [Zygotorulaspora mrakii]QLG74938.1 hypothetical protein HG535_0H02650 [Zygotorulaspora mrakii]